jgi:hypothetical protein
VNLIDMQAQLWQDLKVQLDDLRRDVARVSANSAWAITTDSTRVFPTVAALPTGARGKLATVDDDGTGNPALYWHNGTAWRKVTVT